MPNITITFSKPINVSVQVGDTAYYTDRVTTLGTHNHSNQDDIIQIGEIVCVNQSYGALCAGKPDNSITCNWDPNPTNALYPTAETEYGDFIMFSKDNKANLSNVLGYYTEVKFVNNSPDEAELFSVGSEIFGSSK